MAGLNRLRLTKPERAEALPLPVLSYRQPDDILREKIEGYVRSELRMDGRYLSVSVRNGRKGRTVEVKTTGRRPEPGNPGTLIAFAMPRDYEQAIALLRDNKGAQHDAG